MVLLQRRKSIVAQDNGNGGALILHARLEDEHHLMDVQLVVSPEGEVLSAYATMGEAPYGDQCRVATRAVEGLVGKRIERGSVREVFRAVGGPGGCTHLAELVVDAYRAFLPAAGERTIRLLRARYREQGLSEAETEARVMEAITEVGMRMLSDTCVVYSKDGTKGVDSP